MTDTADQTAPAARDDQPQLPEETPEELLAESLEMPAPGPAPAGFRFPTDAELMDGPNPLTDPDDEREVGRIKGAGGRLQVRVSLVVERDSQKAIIIGKGGRRLKEVGVTARKGIEELLGRKVYLDLHVRTAKDWQSDPKALARLGF